MFSRHRCLECSHSIDHVNIDYKNLQTSAQSPFPIKWTKNLISKTFFKIDIDIDNKTYN